MKGPVPAPSPAPGLPLLEARGLEFGYPDGFRLGPLDLRLHAGEIVALSGEPGAGKSTLLSLLAARRPAERGTLLYRQQPLGARTPRALSAWRRRLGVLEQGALPVPDRSPRDLLHLALAVRGMGGRARRHEATRLLGETGLLARADQPCGALSTGQSRWAQLALALAGLPDVLLLDEPLAHLSPAHQKELVEFLDRLARRGAAVLLCAHGVADALPAGTRRLHLAGGCLQSGNGGRRT